MDNKTKKKNIDYSIYEVTTSSGNAQNLLLPDPGLLSYYRNLDNRVLWLDFPVDDGAIELAKYIIDWNRMDKGIPREKRKKITLMFMSPGGDLEVNNMLSNTIEMSETPIVGVNVGQACSAACYIYLACDKRYSFPDAQFLIHQGSASNISGTYEEVVAYILNYQRQINNLGNYILRKTSITEEEFEEHFDSDWWIDAEEAVKLGMCDKIITSLDEIL